MTQRDGMGREVGGGFRMGNTCIPVADLCQCMAKPIQHCVSFGCYSTVIHLYRYKFSFIFFPLISSVQSLSRVRLFATPWTTACQASLSVTNSQSLPKLISVESVMPSNHFMLCHPLLLLPSIFPRIRVFSNESALCIRWPKYWSFSFSISPSNEYSEFISLRIDWFDLLAIQGLSRVFSSTTVQKHHHFFGAHPSLWSSSDIHT